MNKGYYVLPTIITGITPQMKVAREEIFGPVACFMEPFKSDEEVIALSNDNVYGLTSWVRTTDMARGMRFANKIQAETVGLGQGRGGGGPEFPWGGFKESGIGKEGSLYGMLFTNLKRIAVDLVTPKKPV